MPKSEQREKGLAKFEEVMGFRPPEMEDAFLDVTLDHLFPNVWSRGGLTRRERRLITLTVIMSMGQESALKLHMGAALKSGDLSESDLDELIVHLAHYAGWPVAALGSGVARQLRAQK